jgi:penicillin-binding protein 1A
VVPIELVAAFAPFANGGARVAPRFIEEVRSATGELLWTEPLTYAQAIDPGVAFLMSSLLQDVVEHGTGTAARAGLPPTLPVLGKTGTTNGGQDVWFVGATPQLVAGVWMGFDQPRPLGVAATGGRMAAPVWARTIATWERGKEIPAAWHPPAGVESHEIDVRTGGLATGGCPREQVATEWYLPGTAPQASCSEHQGGLSGVLERVSGWFR